MKAGAVREERSPEKEVIDFRKDPYDCFAAGGTELASSGIFGVMDGGFNREDVIGSIWRFSEYCRLKWL